MSRPLRLKRPLERRPDREVNASGAWLPLLWLLPLLTACQKEGKLTLTDTEGRRVAAQCEQGACDLELSGGPAPTDGSALRLHAEGRLIGLCESDGPSAQLRSPSQCRALTCDRDAQCPPSSGLQQGTCINGLCVEPSHPLGTADAVMLCLAGTGHGRATQLQVERYAMGLNCGSPCLIPKPCRQP